MYANRWGRQPALAALRAERWTIPLAAKTIGVSATHLKNTLHGITRPNATVREELPKLVGRPLDQLYTADVLAKPHCPEKNRWKSARS